MNPQTEQPSAQPQKADQTELVSPQIEQTAEPVIKEEQTELISSQNQQSPAPSIQDGQTELVSPQVEQSASQPVQTEQTELMSPNPVQPPAPQNTPPAYSTQNTPQTHAPQESRTSAKPKMIIPICVAGAVVILAIIGIFIFFSGSDTVETPQTLISLGEQFLLDFDFESALEQFIRVIEIDEIEPRGYTGAAEAYIGLGQLQLAARTLEVGLTVLPGNTEILEVFSAVMQMLHEEEHVMCEHEWLAADCNNPETCATCGETQGELLEHDFTEANFQEPAVCLLCDEQGETLTPGAVEHGIRLNTETSIPFRYDTVTSGNDEILPVTGEVTLVDVWTTDNFDGIDAEEGYEFIVAEISLRITGENARNYGFDYIDLLIDFYTFNPSLRARVMEMEGSSSCAVVSLGQISNHGKKSEFVVLGGIQSFEWSGPQSNRAATMNTIYAVHVPIGYDGIIIAFASGHILWTIDRYDQDYSKFVLDDVVAYDIIDSDTVFFRLRS
jgi:hypothetical protein